MILILALTLLSTPKTPDTLNPEITIARNGDVTATITVESKSSRGVYEKVVVFWDERTMTRYLVVPGDPLPIYGETRVLFFFEDMQHWARCRAVEGAAICEIGALRRMSESKALRIRTSVTEFDLRPSLLKQTLDDMFAATREYHSPYRR